MNPKARQEGPAMSKADQKIRKALQEALHGEVITYTVAPPTRLLMCAAFVNNWA